ncbi:MAG: hypothetical protein GTO60_03755 [Gammaproteobacteria bacterium]|nr:hypothetical protein [Gammaproteobacteria bacterium]
MKIIAFMLLSLMLTGCLADFSKERLAAHKEFCATYKNTQYDCTLPNPKSKVYIPGIGSYIEQGRIYKVDY